MIFAVVRFVPSNHATTSTIRVAASLLLLDVLNAGHCSAPTREVNCHDCRAQRIHAHASGSLSSLIGAQRSAPPPPASVPESVRPPSDF
jgi:hypothetical protein